MTPFKNETISQSVLQRLIKQNVVVQFRMTDPGSKDCYIYERGKKCDYFVLILQGRAEVMVGKEQMIFEAGPFAYFGIQALTG